MVAGIAFQLATMSIFAVLAGDFFLRVVVRNNKSKNVLPREVKLVLLAMAVAFVMIYVRSVYRTVELAQGWDGYLITREGYFIGLDAALMFVAVAVLLVFDPVVLLRDPGPGADVYDSSEPKPTPPTLLEER
ncbi:RTA1 like protein-domain-containing protein [Podospora appendiculata]|uniref:RTA1 like protein-domain-containing protein n=1 Tax=Podospora appendiculata TaxID=314037 RepID=A0AAE1CAT2_9PEZI|nr:RTA1 like protein-domain-containing protein [Podospora appendiculata]